MLDLQFYLNSVNAVGLWLASLRACKEFHNYSVSVWGDKERWLQLALGWNVETVIEHMAMLYKGLGQKMNS